MTDITIPTKEALEHPRIYPITTMDEATVEYLIRTFNGTMDLDTFRGIFDEARAQAARVVDGIFRDGFQTAPLFELAIRERVKYYSDKPAMEVSYRRLEAMTRDITEVLYAHVQYRRAKNGQFVAEWRGPTGMTKSSCMLGFIETTSAMAGVSLTQKIVDDPASLEGHVAYDVDEIPTKLPLLKRGEGIGVDEEIRGVGEGSATKRELLFNLEDMVRQWGVDIHFASPTGSDHGTSQAVFEVHAVDWETQRARFLLSIAYGTPEPLPLGIVELPFASAPAFGAYRPIKDRILERTVRMQFHANAANDADIKKFFDDARITELLRYHGAPARGEWKRWLKRFARSMSMNEQSNLADDVGEMVNLLANGMPVRSFKTIYGWEPSASMLAFAGRMRQRTGRAVKENDGDENLT